MSTRVRAGTGDTKLDRIPFPPEHNIHPLECDSCCRANPCLRLYEYKFLLCYLCYLATPTDTLHGFLKDTSMGDAFLNFGSKI